MTGLQSTLGAFCVMRGMRLPDNNESAANMLRRLQKEDPEGYAFWWEENPDATWERIENDEEYEAARMKAAGITPPVRRSQQRTAAGRPRRK